MLLIKTLTKIYPLLCLPETVWLSPAPQAPAGNINPQKWVSNLEPFPLKTAELCKTLSHVISPEPPLPHMTWCCAVSRFSWSHSNLLVQLLSEDFRWRFATICSQTDSPVSRSGFPTAHDAAVFVSARVRAVRCWCLSCLWIKTTIQCTPFNLQPHTPKLEPHSH